MENYCEISSHNTMQRNMVLKPDVLYFLLDFCMKTFEQSAMNMVK